MALQFSRIESLYLASVRNLPQEHSSIQQHSGTNIQEHSAFRAFEDAGKKVNSSGKQNVFVLQNDSGTSFNSIADTGSTHVQTLSQRPDG